MIFFYPVVCSLYDSCRDWNPGHLDIAFNVVEIPPTAYQVMSRRGLCTGWLDDITRDLQDAETNAENHRFTEDFWVQMTSLHLSDVQVGTDFSTIS